MSPAVIILPSLLLLIVLTLMIGATFWPHLQMDTPEALSIIEHHIGTDKTQAIAKFWGAQLTTHKGPPLQGSPGQLSALPVERMVAALLGKYIYLHGDYPSRLNSRGLRSAMIKKALRMTALDPCDIPAGIKMRITPTFVRATVGSTTSELWQLPEPDVSPADADKPQTGLV